MEGLSGAYEGKSYSPYALRGFPSNIYWGDTHLHTGASMDAGAFGNRLDNRAAFQFARGEQVQSSTGIPVRLSRPLDFLVVSDHSDHVGFFPDLFDGAPHLLADPTGRDWYERIQAGQGVDVALELIGMFSQGDFPERVYSGLAAVWAEARADPPLHRRALLPSSTSSGAWGVGGSQRGMGTCRRSPTPGRPGRRPGGRAAASVAVLGRAPRTEARIYLVGGILRESFCQRAAKGSLPKMAPEHTITAPTLGDPVSDRSQEAENREPSSASQRQSEDDLALFFSESVDLLGIAGLDGYFKRLNPAWTSSLGWSLEELQARPFLDFVHPDDLSSTLEEIDGLAAGKETILFENRYRHRDGSYRWLRWSARSMPDRDRIYAIARDVTRQRRLEREILEIADREKERLGRELHDGLCQTLAGIAALGSTLSRRAAASSEATSSDAAAEIAHLLNAAIGEARDLAHGFGPVGLREAGLDDAIESLAHAIQHRFGISCRLELEGPFPRLCREVEAHLFRIAQEAVSNAVAHGRAGRIQIALSSQDGDGTLIVRDDGVGLPREVRDRIGAGMQTMSYRARIIGGTFEVSRRARRGTAVSCTFPLRDTSHIHSDPNHACYDDA